MVYFMRPLAYYIDDDLKKQSRDQHFFNTVLSRILPPPLNRHVWASGYEKGILRLLTDGPAWATRLRYQQHELLKQLNSDPAVKLNKILITVSNRPSPVLQQKPERRGLSASARTSLQKAASTVSDPELRQIFERLSNR